MHLGQDAQHGRARRARRRFGVVVAAVAVLVPGGVVAAIGSTAAVAATAGTTTTTTTTVVSSSTTVTTTTRPTSVTTTTTTVATTPTTTTSTTATTVTPTTTAPSSTTTTRPKTTTTTTTTVPLAPPPATVVPATGPAAPVVPPPPTFDTSCSRPATPALQTYLDALPAGSVFRSSTTACYDVPFGIRLTKPITIIGGTFYDPTTEPTLGPTNRWFIQPVILVKQASHVTISGVSVLGANTTGGFHADKVTEAGIKLASAADTTLTDITVSNTFGDGLELVADLSSNDRAPVTGLTVDGYTATNTGRQGVTIAEVSGASLDHVNVVHPADAGFDFESDLAGVGSADVAISNCTDTAGFNMVEHFSGSITVTNCTGFHHVTFNSPLAHAQVTFHGGTLTCRRLSPEPCIVDNGGNLTFTGVTIDRMPGTYRVTELMWQVDLGGNLTFVESPMTSPFGTVVRPSTLRIIR